MTLGQRIAQKRRELGLSQEGLGEQLRVSRQAIYKWESDASLPEIDKLIALSKLFSVSVGWLLGVEEENLPQDQEKLVEDVLSRYQAAQPKEQKSVWDKWSVRILFAMCGIMLALLVGTSTKIKEIDRQYADLSRSIDRQISSITSRVEAALEEQTSLISSQDVSLVSADFLTNTAVFSISVTPKTYIEGMTVLLTANNGLESVEVPVEPGPGYTYSGEVSCPLTDWISLSVSFCSEGVSQIQQLDTYSGLYTGNAPWVSMAGIQITPNYPNHTAPPNALNANVWLGDEQFEPEPPASLRVGLFRDRKLVQWFEPGTYSYGATGITVDPLESYPCWTNSREILLENGDYAVAAVYTNASGQQRVYYRYAFHYNQSATPAVSTGYGEVFPSDDRPLDPGDPSCWEF